MLANELRKGDEITLKNGWGATIADNRKGNIRMATVRGYATETGSIYVWDIATPEIDLTKAQAKAKANVEAVFGW
jgi:hypothetical protein